MWNQGQIYFVFLWFRVSTIDHREKLLSDICYPTNFPMRAYQHLGVPNACLPVWICYVEVYSLIAVTLCILYGQVVFFSSYNITKTNKQKGEFPSSWRHAHQSSLQLILLRKIHFQITLASWESFMNIVWSWCIPWFSNCLFICFHFFPSFSCIVTPSCVPLCNTDVNRHRGGWYILQAVDFGC